jgi:hypothetical protein
MTMNTRASRLMESLNGNEAPRKSISQTLAEHYAISEDGTLAEAKKITAKLLIDNEYGTAHGGMQHYSKVSGFEYVWNYANVKNKKYNVVDKDDNPTAIVTVDRRNKPLALQLDEARTVKGMDKDTYDFIVDADKKQLLKMQKELSTEIDKGILADPKYKVELNLINSRLAGSDSVDEKAPKKFTMRNFGQQVEINMAVKNGTMKKGEITSKNYDAIAKLLIGKTGSYSITNQAAAIKNNEIKFNGQTGKKVMKLANFFGKYLRITTGENTLVGGKSEKTYFELDESIGTQDNPINLVEGIISVDEAANDAVKVLTELTKAIIKAKKLNGGKGVMMDAYKNNDDVTISAMQEFSEELAYFFKDAGDAVKLDGQNGWSDGYKDVVTALVDVSG